MDSKSSPAVVVSSDITYYRRNAQAADTLLSNYQDIEMSSTSVSLDNYFCQLFACLLGENYYAFNHCFNRIKQVSHGSPQYQKMRSSIKSIELLMQIGAANYQNNLTHAVQSITIFEKLKDLSPEVKQILNLYKEYMASKILILYIVGYDRFKEKELLSLLNGLGVKEIESVGTRLEGFDSAILGYEGKKGERWVEVKRDLADAFLETYEPSIVKTDLEDIKNLVEVMKLVENKNDWRVDVATQSANEFRMAHHDDSEHDHFSHMLGGGMGPMRFKHFR